MFSRLEIENQELLSEIEELKKRNINLKDNLKQLRVMNEKLKKVVAVMRRRLNK